VSLSEVIQHHSVDDVKGYIHQAEALLVEGGYDDAERIALLPTVIGLLSSKTILQQQPAPIPIAQLLCDGRLVG